MYIVRYQKQTARRFIRMPRDIACRIRDKVESIAENPYGQHSNVTRLRRRESSFRLRFGDWRVVYVLDDERKVLLVAKIDRRGQVYR